MASGIPNNIEGRWYLNGTEITSTAAQLNTAGTAAVAGTSTNDNATAGNIGQYISSSVLIGSAVSLTSSVAANVTSISLTAGDWDVSGVVLYNPNAATTTSYMQVGISQTSATQPTLGAENNGVFSTDTLAAGVAEAFTIGPMRISLAGTTTVYLVAEATFAVNTQSAYGFIGARRVR